MARKTKRPKPYSRVMWRGVVLDARTASAMEWVAKRTRAWIKPSQGSWSGSVAQSAGTHAGSGSIDIACAGIAPGDIRQLVRVLRRAGFAAWFRPAAAPSGSFGGWGPHIHAILLGSKLASPSAVAQMAAYRAGRDGLAGNRPDNSWRPRIKRRWNHRLNRPVLHPMPGQKVSAAQEKLLPPRR